MLERFVKKTAFSSHQDFIENYEILVPENFNFAYDVVDAWAETDPQKRALCWTNDKGAHHNLTFGELKTLSDKTASFFQSLGIGKGDMVMLILKRSIEFWQTILALHKIGAVAIPATHLLTDKDIIYRNNAADVVLWLRPTITDPHVILHGSIVHVNHRFLSAKHSGRMTVFTRW